MSNEYLDIAMKKVVGQEVNKVLHRIWKEVYDLPVITWNKNDVYKADILRIIDKHKVKSEEQE